MCRIEVDESIGQRLQRDASAALIVIGVELVYGAVEHGGRRHAHLGGERWRDIRDGEAVQHNEQERKFKASHNVPDIFGNYVKITGHRYPLSVPSRYVRKASITIGIFPRGQLRLVL